MSTRVRPTCQEPVESFPLGHPLWELGDADAWPESAQPLDVMRVVRGQVVVDEGSPGLFDLALVLVEQRDHKRKPSLPRNRLVSFPCREDRTPGGESFKPWQAESPHEVGDLTTSSAPVTFQRPPHILPGRRDPAHN